MMSIKAILEFTLISVETVGLADGIPYVPAIGIGYLLVERCLFIDVVSAEEFDPVTKFHAFTRLPFIPFEMNSSLGKRLVINFGGEHSTKYILNGKQTKALAIGIGIHHLTSNMLNGFYTMGW
jgi:hypothetical protein